MTDRFPPQKAIGGVSHHNKHSSTHFSPDEDPVVLEQETCFDLSKHSCEALTTRPDVSRKQEVGLLCFSSHILGFLTCIFFTGITVGWMYAPTFVLTSTWEVNCTVNYI